MRDGTAGGQIDDDHRQIVRDGTAWGRLDRVYDQSHRQIVRDGTAGGQLAITLVNGGMLENLDIGD